MQKRHFHIHCLFKLVSFFFLCIRTDCFEGYFWFVFNLKIEAVCLCNRKEKGTFILILPAEEGAGAHLGLSNVLRCFTWPNYSSIAEIQNEYLTCSGRQYIFLLQELLFFQCNLFKFKTAF